MLALESLSDPAILALALATNYPGASPARKLAPRFWEYFADVIAMEIARRRGEGLGVPDPAFPAFTADELEAGGLVLLAMANAERERGDDADLVLAGALHRMGETLVKLLTLQQTESAGN